MQGSSRRLLLRRLLRRCICHGESASDTLEQVTARGIGRKKERPTPSKRGGRRVVARSSLSSRPRASQNKAGRYQAQKTEAPGSAKAIPKKPAAAGFFGIAFALPGASVFWAWYRPALFCDARGREESDERATTRLPPRLLGVGRSFFRPIPRAVTCSRVSLALSP